MRKTDKLLCLTVSIFFLTGLPLFAADTAPITRKIQSIDHSLSNLDQEIATLQQKSQNQDLVLDSIHREVSGLLQAVKESQSKAENSNGTRLKTIEKNIEKTFSDLKQLKTSLNDNVSLLAQLQKTAKEQESLIQLQAEQIKDLESAMRLLASAIQGKPSKTKELSDQQYQVKSGDTLEKIAKAHKTTVEALKAKNGLEKNTIFPGQTLELP
ncbi:MAG: LysM peptidoglycan-binding domain-containing protein [Verrucomicrobia bacterium]|nr:LysM peptidoglycan-binding domain-containing protein [Verrucomicrobiota bacterium]